MRAYQNILITALILCLSMACSQREQDRSRQQAHELANQTKHEAQKLGREAKHAASEISEKTKLLADSAKVRVDTSSDSAERKLRHGATRLKGAGEEANVGLHHAALVAQVKTRLASDLGVGTATDVHVSSNEGVVTLTGAVESSDQKQAAERSARSVDGVERVVNRLHVR